MANIINLRRARKAAQRADKADAAAVNRQRHGEPAHIRKQRKLEKRLTDQRLDNHEVAGDEKP